MIRNLPHDCFGGHVLFQFKFLHSLQNLSFPPCHLYDIQKLKLT